MEKSYQGEHAEHLMVEGSRQARSADEVSYGQLPIFLFILRFMKFNSLLTISPSLGDSYPLPRWLSILALSACLCVCVNNYFNRNKQICIRIFCVDRRVLLYN